MVQDFIGLAPTCYNSGMPHNEPRSTRWRPWQFSLRFLFQLMLVTAAFFGGWVANEWKRERELRQQLQIVDSVYVESVEDYFLKLAERK
jgi:hypothetical protein